MLMIGLTEQVVVGALQIHLFVVNSKTQFNFHFAVKVYGSSYNKKHFRLIWRMCLLLLLRPTNCVGGDCLVHNIILTERSLLPLLLSSVTY